MTMSTAHGSLPVVNSGGEPQARIVGHVLGRGFSVLVMPDSTAAMEGRSQSECRLVMHPHPIHIPRAIAWLITNTAGMLPEHQQLRVHGALCELLCNAVEHGTLAISFRTKQQALAEGWYDEVLRQRLIDPCYKDRQVTVQVCQEWDAKRVTYRITDEGTGFMWRRLLTHSPHTGNPRAVNGRGIFLARCLFPSLTYNERGNEAIITVSLA